jgi:ABC-type glutathione transport system ATPase component
MISNPLSLRGRPQKRGKFKNHDSDCASFRNESRKRTASNRTRYPGIRNISKAFPNVQALSEVSLDIRPGEILAFMVKTALENQPC